MFTSFDCIQSDMYASSSYSQDLAPYGAGFVPSTENANTSNPNHSTVLSRRHFSDINYFNYKYSYSPIDTADNKINSKEKPAQMAVPINQILDQLLNVTCNRSLPKFEEVEICKSNLKYHSKSCALFSVLSELKEGCDNMNNFVFGEISANVRNLRGIKKGALTKSQDNTQSDNQLMRLDNMLAKEGIINREEGSVTDDKCHSENSPKHYLKQETGGYGTNDYQNKLSKIRIIYHQEANKIDDELNIFPLHISNLLRQQSEIRPIRQVEIEVMQKVVNKKYSILHMHLRQKTCEAIMVLRTKCFDARRKRRNFSKKSSEVLNAFFYENLAHPYPSEEKKQELAKTCGITVSQVCNWFGNKRIRYKKNVDRAEDEAKLYATKHSVVAGELTYSPTVQMPWDESGYTGIASFCENQSGTNNNIERYGT